tara:strand:- start:34937 stop:35062 length:126 start_codon:yes stop_codon:yes gene_type:complete
MLIILKASSCFYYNKGRYTLEASFLVISIEVALKALQEEIT